MKKIEMVDLRTQYAKIKTEIDTAIQNCINNSNFIKGEHVSLFQEELAAYLGVKHVIACANGTDALQIAMMGLGLQPGDEVIVPAFTYVATAEVIGLLRLTPVMIDVDENTFNINIKDVKQAVSGKTKAIVPVHLFGQCTDMEELLLFAKEQGLYIIEDTAQAIVSKYSFTDGRTQHAGTMGDIGCTSFFPSKNLGCFGDGGALFTNDDAIAERLRMIANHGQRKQYYHEIIGVNSRLDAIQAAILRVKLKYINAYSETRQKAAHYYDTAFKDIKNLQTPYRSSSSTHVFHQYTLRVTNGQRDALRIYLAEHNIPSMVYYPMPLQQQQAFENLGRQSGNLSVSEQLCKEVISLPMHTELDDEQLAYISDNVVEFFKS
jgi:UDP-2-acetamido-2-deoxy-ribo-hexuluronate aminotransferase